MKMTKQLTSLIFVGALLLTAGACGITKHKENAEQAVTKFHQQLNAAQYHEMYVQSDKGFQDSTSEADAVAIFEGVHRKLGNVNNATSAGWHVNATPGGTFVTLGYNVDFSEGKGTEQFVFKMNGNQALLFNYNVNSPLLITK
jgi:hypothetical protein